MFKNGVLSGTPQVVGVATITLYARDTTGHCGNHAFTLNIESNQLATTYKILCN